MYWTGIGSSRWNCARSLAVTAGSAGVSGGGRNGVPGARWTSTKVSVTTARTMAIDAATRRTSHAAT